MALEPTKPDRTKLCGVRSSSDWGVHDFPWYFLFFAYNYILVLQWEITNNGPIYKYTASETCVQILSR